MFTLLIIIVYINHTKPVIIKLLEMTVFLSDFKITLK